MRAPSPSVARPCFVPTSEAITRCIKCCQHARLHTFAQPTRNCGTATGRVASSQSARPRQSGMGPMAYDFAFRHIDDVLGDVGGMVGDALQVS
jgi:hypothetical protein